MVFICGTRDWTWNFSMPSMFQAYILDWTMPTHTPFNSLFWDRVSLSYPSWLWTWLYSCLVFPSSWMTETFHKTQINPFWNTKYTESQKLWEEWLQSLFAETSVKGERKCNVKAEKERKKNLDLGLRWSGLQEEECQTQKHLLLSCDRRGGATKASQE